MTNASTAYDKLVANCQSVTVAEIPEDPWNWAYEIVSVALCILALAAVSVIFNRMGRGAWAFAPWIIAGCIAGWFVWSGSDSFSTSDGVGSVTWWRMFLSSASGRAVEATVPTAFLMLLILAVLGVKPPPSQRELPNA
jgi:hypothetical protein